MIDTSETDDNITIRQTRRRTGFSTIRYWMETGKVKPVSYTASGYALFSIEQKVE